MQNFWNVILNSVCFYLIIADTILFLHCFYDAAFLWSKKKALIILGVLVIQTAVAFIFPGNVNVMNWVFFIPFSFVATYDYTGKRSSGIWRFIKFLLFIQLMVLTYCVLAATCITQSLTDSLISFEGLASAGEYDQAFENVFTLSIDVMLIRDVLVTIAFGTIFPLLYSVYNKGVVIRCGKREVWIVLVASCLSYALLCFVIIGIMIGEMMYLRYALALVGILLGVLFPVFVYFTRFNEYYRSRTAIQEQHIQAELEHFQQYRKMQEETARFRHDIRNNLLCANNMLQQGKTEDVAEYLKDLLQTVETLSNKYVTGDELLDSIVAVKAQIMEQQGIRFERDGVFAGGLPWKPMDICNVFANALDNAIEASRKVEPEKRSISMNIRSTPRFWLVTIKNSVAEKVDVSKLFQKNGGYTSKSDSAPHGIGTYNMKYTVESYGAMLKAECTEETFTIEIAIDKNSPE